MDRALTLDSSDFEARASAPAFNRRMTVPQPNTSIVLPGGCPARCAFCFWKEAPAGHDYLDRLRTVLRALPSQFKTLSLTGGEPSLSPALDDVLGLVTKRWRRVVLTTNGMGWPPGRLERLAGVVHALNISRHHWDDGPNRVIFGGADVPGGLGLAGLIVKANHVGIPVTLNCVLTKHMEPVHEAIARYCDFARAVGASAVCFRRPHAPNSDTAPSAHEAHWRPLLGWAREQPCPVCRSAEQLARGMRIVWKSAVGEPSVRLGYVYEAIVQPDGRLTADWDGALELQPKALRVKGRRPRETSSRPAVVIQPYVSIGESRGSSGSCGAMGGC